MTRRILILGSAAAALSAAEAQGAAEASLESFAWLAGRWQGQLPWGAIEEIWSPAAEGVMMGMFRMSNRGKPSLYEFMTLEQRGVGVMLRIRHFNGLFVAREEKDKAVDFTLTSAVGAESKFFLDEGDAKVTLVYRKTGPAAMEVDFNKVPAEGKAQAMKFPYRRAPL
jgi:hypothetical protein